MSWTIVKIIISIAVIILWIYVEYKSQVRILKKQERRINDANTWISSCCSVFLVFLGLKPFYHWLKTYLPGEGLRALICLIIFCVVIFAILLIARALAKHELQKEAANEV